MGDFLNISTNQSNEIINGMRTCEEHLSDWGPIPRIPPNHIISAQRRVAREAKSLSGRQ